MPRLGLGFSVGFGFNAVEVEGSFWFLADHDRPLSKSGRADAAAVSMKLKQMDWIPELVLSRLDNSTREIIEWLWPNVFIR